MRSLIVKLKYVMWSLSRINKPHLGDLVIVKNTGKKFILIQGVASPYWDLHNHIDGRINRIHSSEFKLINPIRGRIDRFINSYKFQMGNWFRIDTCNKPLFSRISYK